MILAVTTTIVLRWNTEIQVLDQTQSVYKLVLYLVWKSIKMYLLVNQVLLGIKL